jgi:hypothetical protein
MCTTAAVQMVYACKMLSYLVAGTMPLVSKRTQFPGDPVKLARNGARGAPICSGCVASSNKKQGQGADSKDNLKIMGGEGARWQPDVGRVTGTPQWRSNVGAWEIGRSDVSLIPVATLMSAE